MRTLLFTLILMTTPCYADSLWGDFGDVGPGDDEYLDEYVGDPKVYGSIQQQLFNLEVDTQMRNVQQQQYQEKMLKEMRRANDIAEQEAKDRRFREDMELFER